MNAYELAFKYEILNGVIARIAALIARNSAKTLPERIKPLDNELWGIYRRIQTADDPEELDRCGKRLRELRGEVREVANGSESGFKDPEEAAKWIFERLTEGKRPISAACGVSSRRAERRGKERYPSAASRPRPEFRCARRGSVSGIPPVFCPNSTTTRRKRGELYSKFCE